jgi:hypothetical protein
MELKRAEILGEKTAKCFACVKTKKVLITKEKSTGKILHVCKECIEDAGEEEVFYSDYEAKIRENKWTILSVKMLFFGMYFWAGVLILFVISRMLGLGIFTGIFIPFWVFMLVAYMVIMSITSLIGYAQARKEVKKKPKPSLRVRIREGIDRHLSHFNPRVRIFYLASLVFLAFSAFSFAFPKAVYYMMFIPGIDIFMSYMDFWKYKGAVRYLPFLLLFSPHILATAVSHLTVRRNKRVGWVKYSKILLKGKPKDVVDRANNIMGFLMGVQAIFFGLLIHVMIYKESGVFF